MAKQNVLNRATQDLTVDPGAAGDSWLQFDINTTNEFRIGVDDDSGDAFKISQGGALGANDTLIATAAGEVTFPLQPCFGANNSATDSNVTGDGTLYGPIVFDNEVWDQNSDYNNGTGVFTASVTGRYFFSSGLVLDGLLATHTSIIYRLNGSNRDAYGYGYNITAGMYAGMTYFNLSSFLDMDAADTAYIDIQVGGGTKVVDVYGAATVFYTAFCGYLAV